MKKNLFFTGTLALLAIASLNARDQKSFVPPMTTGSGLVGSYQNTGIVPPHLQLNTMGVTNISNDRLIELHEKELKSIRSQLKKGGLSSEERSKLIQDKKDIKKKLKELRAKQS